MTELSSDNTVFKLLIIDDDTVDRMTIIRALKQSHHSMEFTEASSAEEGLDWIQKKQYDLVLLDYQLPTMTGLELLDHLNRSTLHRAAIVMLSHNEDDALAIQCIEAGAQDFITKGEINVFRLTRAILHAKERFRIEEKLSKASAKLRQLEFNRGVSQPLTKSDYFNKTTFSGNDISPV
jgi:DNA-binding NarL/FixJ family response regulator